MSILRSGAILEPAIRRAFPALPLGSLLIQSSSTNHLPLLYSVSLPSFVRDKHKAEGTWVILSDAQIGTGAAAAMAVRVLLDHGVPQHQIIFLALVASARGGLWVLHRMFPQVQIVVGGVDPGLRRILIDNPPELPAPNRRESHSRQGSDASLGSVIDDAPHNDTPSRMPARKAVFAIIPGCGSIGDRFWGT